MERLDDNDVWDEKLDDDGDLDGIVDEVSMKI
jgi:hypothetical protein